MVLELLADAPDIAGGKVQPLPTEGKISALNIPHSSIVFDLYQVTEIKAELLGGNGVTAEKIMHANLVSFTCLKAFAFDQRFERKAGKTVEFRQRASVLERQGKPSFFIRIEDIEADFYKAFEVGEENIFQSWLQSTRAAWFFLDSVDEARLEHPRTFEKALRRFSKVIQKGAHRAHIYLSSRPDAWRPKEDRRLFDDLLFLVAEPESDDLEEDVDAQPQSAFSLYTMRPLNEERIRRFCEARCEES